MVELSVKKEGTLLTFNHSEKGIATFDYVKQESFVNGKKKNNLIGFFQHLPAPVRHSGNYYDYWWNKKIEGSEVIKKAFENLEDKSFSEFVFDVFEKHNKFKRVNYINLGRILLSFKEFENNMNWKNLNIKCDVLMNFGPQDFDKNIISILKKNDFVFGEEEKSLLNHMPKGKEIFAKIILALDYEKIENNFQANNRWPQRKTWELIFENSGNIGNLLEHNYNMNDILRYLFNYILVYENLDITTAFTLLTDYSSLYRKMNVTEYKKYPKFLKSNHDIVAGEYKRFEEICDEQKFSAAVNKNLEYENKDFLVAVPKSSKDVKDEGKFLGHCVGSYVDRILNGQTQIVFLRKEKDKSLVTLEIRDKVLIQAKGLSNRETTKEEREWIDKYCKEKELLVRI